ncbi:MAG: UDP-N-acetylglucosamine--N-acetylmuramyl-(pentapeptide) pyrophosphoryl-undecaprenol N-acetylglucosamine transferase [Roseburia sp.]|nr:UDP-N-acetylglucosamine--N-acetylmuramyl-(pentapeptide) pyrophosphoryl-undecaprenol N-acetylglucosamine transferase [Anaeroplasma bactoclasticum]MCM1196473.1 UDP-N-acetylglucosamine--N-acetylmuramyl-(pentapeptide) pyrophosphoryl-undecaprenol N-acetylglucosamine transferase [Roseburia sp.]MCM1556514.1 UDP-N-acetylglucosamine--N-acetylmuramyl-(pentapeptide) pyrophosphoryl-undecaprenol N-acetylglucosamine transferase [Anaeroplasma bactoclasticum]
MIVLTGGKTGGHIMPLLALAKQLNNVCYVGTANSLEERLCKKNQVEFLSMPLKNNHILEVLKCCFKLKLKNVEAIISTGGYVSFPGLLYGIFHRIPIYLLEENVIMGRTNRFFSFFAKKVFLTYPLKKMKKKYYLAGLPTMPNKTSYLAYKNLTIDVLLIGGSLGSRPLCDLVYKLKKRYKVCLVAGRYYKDYQDIKGIKVFEYVDDLPNLMLQARTIISRAGASTTYEIFSIGKPCILIPSEKTSKNHQYLNALYFEKKGCCRLLREKDAQTEISSMVSYLLENSEARMTMIEHQQHFVTKNSSEKIIKEIGI